MTPDDQLVEAHLAWCRHRNLRPSTLSSRAYHLRRLRADLSLLEATLTTATPEILRAWQVGLTMGVQGRRNLVNQARAFYRWAAEHRAWPVALVHCLEPPTAPRRLPRPITDTDLAIALIQAPERIRPWLLLAAGAGLRASEVAQLRAEDLDLSRRTVFVVDGKGGQQRMSPFSVEVADELAACRLPRRGWLFLGQTRQREQLTTPVNAERVSHLGSRYLHDVGSTSTFHSLRHYAGTAFFRACRDPRLTQEFLGHRSLATVSLYTAIVPTEMAAAAERIPMPLPARAA